MDDLFLFTLWMAGLMAALLVCHGLVSLWDALTKGHLSEALRRAWRGPWG